MNILLSQTYKIVDVPRKESTKLSFMRACLIILSCIIFSVPLLAADPPTDHPLSLQECIDYALKQHSSVLSAEKDVIASQAGLRSAIAGFLPRITVGSDFTGNGSSTAGINTSYNGTRSLIGVEETLWDGGRIQTSIRQARASNVATQADYELTKQERILSVTTAYFTALLTKRLAGIAAQSVAESEGQRELIQARIDEGDAARVDIYPVEVQLANAKLNKLQADNDVRVAMSVLRNAIGFDRGPEMSLVDVEEPTNDIGSMDECLTSAMSSRPEITRSNAQLDSSRAGLSLAKLQALPVLSVGAGYDRALGGLDYDSQWSVGVGVSMSIFDGGAIAAGIDSAKARTDSAVLGNDQLGKDVTTEVEEAYLNLTNAFERLAASKPNVELAKTNLEVAREKYRQQLAIPLEIVTAQVSYADAQASHAQALYDCYVARAQLDKAMGKRGY